MHHRLVIHLGDTQLREAMAENSSRLKVVPKLMTARLLIADNHLDIPTDKLAASAVAIRPEQWDDEKHRFSSRPRIPKV